MTNEPIITMPTRRLIATVLVSAIVAGGGWMAVVAALGMDTAVIAAGGPGAGVVALVALGGLLVTQPWKPREVSWWATMWLASTVVRLLVTPVAAYLLYSATPLSLTPLMLSVAIAYAVVLAGEVAVVALHVKRFT